MNTTLRRISVALALLAVGAAAACSNPAVGEPTEVQAPPVTEVTYHPCDGLPAEAIRLTKLDVRPPEHHDVEPPKTLGCGYLSHEPRYGINITAKERTFDVLETSDRFTTLDDVRVAGRRALVQDFPDTRSCLVSVEITPGVLDFQVGYGSNETFTTPAAACDQAMKIVNTLAPYFPEHL
ncbi:DUF3558 family protein [Rhodococcus marinonascens]|uniref:DUF3558 family protein n=1 Tax=Rhodococcus marinonascens TaxID=38311 RepID=UPI0009335A17|nr:DUF3558 family protein [Rhodococcus marinonascens]